MHDLFSRRRRCELILFGCSIICLAIIKSSSAFIIIGIINISHYFVYPAMPSQLQAEDIDEGYKTRNRTQALVLSRIGISTSFTPSDEGAFGRSDFW